MERFPVLCRDRGFTLVEVLVAVLVLALGLIGGMGMQLQALRTRYESAQLSKAVQLGAEMAERIRANAAQADAYLGFEYEASGAPLSGGWAGGAPYAGCRSVACSPAELAADELESLKRAVAQQFPTGRVRICRDTKMWTGGRLRWACSGGAAAPVVIKIGWRGKNPDGTLRTFGALDTSPGVAIAVAVPAGGGGP